jgi:hypothetical protein
MMEMQLAIKAKLMLFTKKRKKKESKAKHVPCHAAISEMH